MRLTPVYVLLLACLAWLPVQSFAEDAEGGEGGVYYFELSPGFVTNYGGPGRLKYLKADVTLEMSDPRAFQAVEQHEPLIRNTIVMNLSRQTENNVITARGQERIRKELLEVVNRTLRAEVGSDVVEDVLITDFIYQN
ncbi:flagellar basal body-associated FliL family protein [Marinospirillum perlucidum]|uniref:flagellar basal body-associated FliL family protein n=1 Tax=Marinospirillum perlucidum TaxID=1982602 RepID=UPI000DF441E2|nr:flagellar basal body-associated FliL family protein [Marinospirillum perlucidum]